MSFLVDPPLLVASGAAIARGGLPPAVSRRAEQAVVGIFIATSVSLYFDREWTRGLWELCRARSGRDWMLNSGVFHFDEERAGPATHALAAAIFATYPLWVRLGRRLGRRQPVSG